MGGFYFPPSKCPALITAGNLLLHAFFGESQPCGQTGRAVQPRGVPRIPLPSAGRGQMVPASLGC